MTSQNPRRRTATVSFGKWFPVMIAVLLLALTAVWFMASSTPVDPAARKDRPAADST